MYGRDLARRSDRVGCLSGYRCGATARPQRLERNDRQRQSADELFVRLSFRTALTILISSVWVEREDVPVGEYHALLMFATFGMMLMASGNDLVIIFLGLETLSIATYVMAGLRKADLQIERIGDEIFYSRFVRLRRFCFTEWRLIYGATGSTNVTEIAAKDRRTPNFPALLAGRRRR